MIFTVEGEPQGKGRPRFGNGRTYTPKRTKDYEKRVAAAYLAEAHTRFEKGVPVSIGINAFYSIPKRTHKTDVVLMETGHIRPQKKPDIDNVVKVVMDAVNGIAYEDDSQVVSIVTRKWYSSRPRIEVEIRRVEE